MTDIKRTVRGIGYDSKGTHKSYVNGVKSRSYQIWQNMLTRCYAESCRDRYYMYIGCTVVEEWQDYQNFAEWYTNHPYSGYGYNLDKDLLLKGNKVYSPETCCFVPPQINSLILDSRKSRGDYKQGVSLKKGSSKFRACLNVKGNCVELGYFETEEEAFRAYKQAKEKHVKETAEEWKSKIDSNVYIALLNWEVN